MTSRTKRLARRWISAVAAVVASTSCWPRRAQAMMIPYYDDDSLAFAADVVVLATRLSTRDAGPYRAATTYRVDKVYEGALQPGAIVELDDHGYEARTEGFGEKPIPDDGQRVLFVTSGRASGDPPVIVGAHLLSRGRIYEYVQMNNPGGLSPTPMLPEGAPATTGGVPPLAVTLAELELTLTAAVARATELHAALREKDPRAMRERALAALGPPTLAHERSRVGASGQPELRALGRALADAGDVEGAVAVMARLATEDEGTPGVVLPRGPVLAMARDRTRAPAIRVAAVTAWSDASSVGQVPVQDIAPLLSDPSPDVRRAAVHAVAKPALVTSMPPIPSQPGASRDLLLPLWKTEGDPWVRAELETTLRYLNAVPPPPPEDTRTIFGVRSGPRGAIEACFQGGVRPAIHAVAVDARGVRREEDLAWASEERQPGCTHLVFAPALAAGVYRLDVTATFEVKGTRVPRTAVIERLDVGPRATLTDAAAGALTTPPKRGCAACAMSGVTGGAGDGAADGAAAFCGLLALARVTRRRARRPRRA